VNTNAEVPDDSSIGDEQRVWRRIGPLQYTDHGDGRIEAMSGAFADSKESPLSVDLAETAGSPQKTRQGWDQYGVVEIRVGDVRALGLGVTREPREGNDAHAYVHGKKTKGVQRRLRQAASWVIKPQIRST
jgi:hypothetical protein